MKTKRTLTIIVLLGFSLTAVNITLWAGTAGILPGADALQEKTEKKEEEKKEEEKDKKKEEKDKKIKRSWTDEDLKKINKRKVNITEVPPDPAEKKGSESVPTPPAPVTTRTGKKKFIPKKTEKYWRERKSALVEKIKANEAEIKNMQAKIYQLKNQLPGTDILSDRLRIEKEIRDTTNRLEAYNKGLENLKKDLENLPDEARKAGALPGWLRD